MTQTESNDKNQHIKVGRKLAEFHNINIENINKEPFVFRYITPVIPFLK